MSELLDGVVAHVIETGHRQFYRTGRDKWEGSRSVRVWGFECEDCEKEGGFFEATTTHAYAAHTQTGRFLTLEGRAEFEAWLAGIGRKTDWEVLLDVD